MISLIIGLIIGLVIGFILGHMRKRPKMDIEVKNVLQPKLDMRPIGGIFSGIHFWDRKK